MEDRFRVWELEVRVPGTWLRYEREVNPGFKNKARRSPAGCGCFLKVGGIHPCLYSAWYLGWASESFCRFRRVPGAWAPFSQLPDCVNHDTKPLSPHIPKLKAFKPNPQPESIHPHRPMEPPPPFECLSLRLWYIAALVLLILLSAWPTLLVCC